MGMIRRLNLNRETLERLYCKEKKSLAKIAKIFSCSISTIRNRCLLYGIEIHDPRKSSTGARVLRSIYFDKVHLEKLDQLSAKTGIPKAAFVREGINLVLRKYESEQKGRNKKR